MKRTNETCVRIPRTTRRKWRSPRRRCGWTTTTCSTTSIWPDCSSPASSPSPRSPCSTSAYQGMVVLYCLPYIGHSKSTFGRRWCLPIFVWGPRIHKRCEGGRSLGLDNCFFSLPARSPDAVLRLGNENRTDTNVLCRTVCSLVLTRLEPAGSRYFLHY